MKLSFSFFVMLLSVLLFCLYRVECSKQQCTSEDFNYGQWVKGAEQCGMLTKYDPNNEVHPFSDFCWKPNNCEAKKFDTSNFCEMVKGKNILLVGDSLMRHFYVAFHKLVSHKWDLKIVRSYLETRICNGTTSFIFVENSHLYIKGAHDDKTMYNLVNQYDWVDRLDNTDILIMNDGHHVLPSLFPDALFKSQTLISVKWLQNYMDTYRNVVKQDVTAVSEAIVVDEKSSFDSEKSRKLDGTGNGLYDNADVLEPVKKATPELIVRPLSIYFMETSPGQAQCSEESVPDETNFGTEEIYLEKLARYQADKLTNYPNAVFWGWWRFERHDAYIKTLLEIYTPYVTILPVNRMSFARPDSLPYESGDCLHYRMDRPTAIDGWVYVWYNLLLGDVHFQKV